MLADVASNELSVLWVGMGQNVLNEVVTILITGDVDQWDTRTIETTFADPIKVAAEKVGTTNLEALLNNLGSKLIHAVLGGIADDMIDGSAAISWGTVLTDVLDAPVAELTMSNNINATKDLLNARSLEQC